MFLLLVILLLPLVRLGNALDCPNGCDCLQDPLNPSQLVVECRLGSTSKNLSFSSYSIRSLRLLCTDYSLKSELFDDVGSLHDLKIQGCHIADPARLLKNLEQLRSLEMDEVTSQGPALSLKEKTFASMSRLESLKMTRCGLQRLPLDIFCSLKNLQVLNVSNNVLNTVKTEDKCTASYLIIADFSRNDLDKIGDSFKVMPAVRQLSLSHNRFSSFPKSVLQHVVLLQQLDLEDNLLDTIEGLPETLIHINMAYNRLSVIPAAIAQLTTLVSLNLSHNAIDESSPSVLVSSSIESLDLSFNRINIIPSRLIPNSMTSLVHLNLEANSLDKLDLKNFTRLQTLNVASNRLKIIRDEAFSESQKLSLLKLRNNSLDTIEPSAFADVAIDDLDLSGNRFTEAPMAIARLHKLKKIDLSRNKISKLYQFVFNKIPHLHLVNISQNELSSIGPYIFSDSEHLATLDLSRNQISMLFKDSLVKCPQLKKVDLSRNRLASFEDSLYNAPSIKKLDLSHNRLNMIQWDALPEKLETLHADHNFITILGASSISRIRSASLRKNSISQLLGEQIPNSIEQLDLSDNRIQSIAPGTFGSKGALRSLNLSGNQLTTLPRDTVEVLEAVHSVEIQLAGNPLKCSCDLDWIKKNTLKRRLIVSDEDQAQCEHALEKRIVRLTDVNPEDLLCTYSQMCEPECICCQYGNCDCKAICPTGCSCFRDASFERNIVKCANMSQTHAKLFTPSDVPMSATHVYLSGLSMNTLRSHSFMGRTRLQHLHMNASRIEHIHPKAFNSLPALKLLDLSDNSIERLTGEEFHKTNGISHLFLNGNLLTTVEDSLMKKLPALQLLTLHKNRLTNITSALANAQVLSVSLSSNPFRCDCSPKHSAAHWVAANRERVVDVDRLLCVENVTKAFRENDTTVLSAYPPNVGHDIFTMPMDEFLRDFNRSICVPVTHGFFGAEPQNSILIFIFVVACVVLLVLMVLLFISMAKRTHYALNQRRYQASSSLNCSSTAGSSPLPMPLINYDIFISYSEADRDVVMREFVSSLQNDYTICLLQRDCPKLTPQFFNVSDKELERKMEASRCLLLILSKDFLKNEWNTFAIKNAHRSFSKDRSKRLIAVYIDDIDKNTLDHELGHILRKCKCLKLGSPMFEEHFRGALPTHVPSETSQIYSDVTYGIVPSALV